MAYIKIWIHFVWGTKSRKPLISTKLKPILIKHIKENAESKKIYIDSIDGGKEHIHILMSLGASQSISKVANLLKGESSHWVNEQNIISGKFDWQDEYFAVSVSESMVNKVRKYIRKQEEHHRKKSFQEEYDEFIKNYRFNK